ncbi:DUF2092 domain-containing protein [Sinorhizobium fredii]|uniref:DUF2092 domain-containing protein n=1 Tax=Rhizobium fredii TaxID=380 RepID=UPI003512ED89
MGLGYYFFHWIGSVEVWNDACPGCIAHWQLWVERGPAPIPRKYVITSKTMAAAPQYTLRIKSWDTDTPPDAKSFAFAPPQGRSRSNSTHWLMSANCRPRQER